MAERHNLACLTFLTTFSALGLVFFIQSLKYRQNQLLERHNFEPKISLYLQQKLFYQREFAHNRWVDPGAPQNPKNCFRQWVGPCGHGMEIKRGHEQGEEGKAKRDRFICFYLPTVSLLAIRLPCFNKLQLS